MHFQSQDELREFIRDLYRKGRSRMGIHDQLVAEGLTDNQATDALDGAPVDLPKPGEPPPLPDPGPEGIGGWLVLPAIGLVLSAALAVASVLKLTRLDGSPQAVQLEARFPGYAELLRGEVWANVFLLALTVVAAVLFFAKKRAAPIGMIVLLMSGMVIAVGDQLLVTSVVPTIRIDLRVIVSSVGAAAFWSAYFLRSERVRNTFVK